MIEKSLERPLLALLRCESQRRVAAIRRNAKQGCNGWQACSQISAFSFEQIFKFLEPHFATVLALEPGRVLETGDDWMQGAAHMLWRALVQQRDVRIIAKLLQ